MTEIPEHLLNRSKARRAAASGESSSETAPAVAASSSPAAATPAPTPTEAPKPKVAPPDPPYVAAAKSRRKIPFWAMSGLALLPLWALLYLVALEPEPTKAEGPIAKGIEVYGGCAGCHGANGSGGAGQVLYQGEVMKTFPHIEDMLNYVYNGSQKYISAGLESYGDPNREGGARALLGYNGAAMPQQGESAGGALTEYEILGVVCHIRYDLSGADPADEQWAAEYEHWCSADSPIFKALQDGSSSFDTVADDFADLMPAPLAVGTEPRAGSSR